MRRVNSGWHLTGQLEVADGSLVRLKYVVQCDLSWCTRSAYIEGEVDQGALTFALAVDASGAWSDDGVPQPHLAGALDVDFGFTPATNMLPIRRLALDVGESAPLRSAWLRFPEFRLEPLEQTYTRQEERVFRYRALIDGVPFVARLDTDDYGHVLRYENCWEAEFLVD